MDNRIHAAPGPLRRGVRLLRAMARQGAELQLQHTAASLAFLSLLAIVPIVSVVLAVFAALPAFAELRGEMQRFLAANLFVPGFGDTVGVYLHRFAGRASELSLAATVVFFATAFGMLLTLDRVLNRIWATSRPRPLSQRLTLYWATLTIAPILLGASLALNGMIVGEWLQGRELLDVRAAWFAALRWLISGGGLVLLYRLVPNTPVRWRDALWGALLAAVLMELLRRGFGYYVARLPTYTVVYGAFAVLPVFLLWLFLLWSSVLTGALLASRLPLRMVGRQEEIRVDTARTIFIDAASVIAELGRVVPGAQGAGFRAARWRHALGGNPGRALNAAQLLAAHGYLSRMIAFGQEDPAETGANHIWNEHWSLARPAHELSVRPLFDAVWGGESATAGLAELDLPLGVWADGAGRALGATPGGGGSEGTR